MRLSKALPFWGSKSSRLGFNPARIIVLGFFSVIIIGALLLALPVSSRSGAPVPFITALFTSTSAACVTGLVTVNTYETWSVFGRVVILSLIQVGGLGFMSIMTIFFFLTNKKIDLSQRLLIVQSLNLKDIKGVVKLVRHVLIGTLFFELTGAIILWIRFAPIYGVWDALGMGVFHSVSAFCNAGFDLLGEQSGITSSAFFAGDKIALLTVTFLVIIGGLGFFVWEDIWKNRRFKKLHLHSKLVLVITLILITFGMIYFYIAERTNPDTIGKMSFTDAAMASLFQSAMTRSGGFSMVNQSSLTGVSKMLTIILMFIGGSAGSTAGGIKNTTAGILFLSAVNSLRGKSKTSAFGRTIPSPQIISALSIMLTVMVACVTGTAAISIIQRDIPFFGVLFETMSAIAICGLSHDTTPLLAPASQVIIILFMFFGRVGIMTLGMAAVLNRGNKEKTKYPDTWIMMG